MLFRCMSVNLVGYPTAKIALRIEGGVHVLVRVHHALAVGAGEQVFAELGGGRPWARTRTRDPAIKATAKAVRVWEIRTLITPPTRDGNPSPGQANKVHNWARIPEKSGFFSKSPGHGPPSPQRERPAGPSPGGGGGLPCASRGRQGLAAPRSIWERGGRRNDLVRSSDEDILPLPERRPFGKIDVVVHQVDVMAP